VCVQSDSHVVPGRQHRCSKEEQRGDGRTE
jgi:hypothetical protein